MFFFPFSYRAWVLRMDWTIGQLTTKDSVHDGDSCWLLLDKGEREYRNSNTRLFGINTEELNSTDPLKRQEAQRARDWLRSQIEGKQVFVLSKGLEKYGRPLVILWLNETDFGDTPKSINNVMIQTGLATPYSDRIF